MLTGIMAMFEMAMSFNSQQLQFRPLQLQDAYSGSEAQAVDRRLLRLFSQEKLLDTLGNEENEPWSGADLCDQLICKFDRNAKNCADNNEYDENLFEGSFLQEKGYLSGEQTKSNAVNLSGACVLAAESHRVLVVPSTGDSTPPYRLYSCLTSQEQPQCLFETKD